MIGKAKRASSVHLPKKSTKRFIALFLFVILLFFIGNLFVRVPVLVRKIQRPFLSLEGDFANSKKLNLASRSSLLLLNYGREGELRQAWVATYEPAGKQINLAMIPVEVPIATKLDKQLSLRGLIQSSFDRSFWEVSSLVGAPLNGYLAFSDAGDFLPDSLLTTRKNVLSLMFFLTIFEKKSWLDEHLKTNLTVGDLFATARVFKAVNLEGINFVDLGSSVIGGAFDSEKLANQTKPLFIDSEIADEAPSVKIVNGSDVAGLGASFKRMIANLGGRVVGVETEKASKTRVIAGPSKKKLAEKIARFLGTEVVVEKGEPSTDVTIILGVDLAKKINLN